MNSKNRSHVLIVVGSTAVGKTDLSIELAKSLNGEIISADSRLLYRGMDIGTAKPTRELLDQVRHHLIDVAEPNEMWSLAHYHKMVQLTMNDILYRGKLPILVGGTGQYIRSLTEGWEVPAVFPNDELRTVLEDWGKQIGPIELHKKLAMIDLEAAKKNDAQNLRRTIRALEVIFTTGLRFSELRQKTKPQYAYKVIGLTRTREELFNRVDERIDKMFDDGFVEEVEKLMKKGYSRDLPSMSAIGYCEVAQFLEGIITLEEAKEIMKKKTRQFVRRQANWFKQSDPNIDWFEMEPNPLERIQSSVNTWLAGE